MSSSAINYSPAGSRSGRLTPDPPTPDMVLNGMFVRLEAKHTAKYNPVQCYRVGVHGVDRSTLPERLHGHPLLVLDTVVRPFSAHGEENLAVRCLMATSIDDTPLSKWAMYAFHPIVSTSPKAKVNPINDVPPRSLVIDNPLFYGVNSPYFIKKLYQDLERAGRPILYLSDGKFVKETYLVTDRVVEVPFSQIRKYDHNSAIPSNTALSRESYVKVYQLVFPHVGRGIARGLYGGHGMRPLLTPSSSLPDPTERSSEIQPVRSSINAFDTGFPYLLWGFVGVWAVLVVYQGEWTLLPY